MKWHRIDAYHFERECHRYTVSVSAAPWSPTGQRFHAWRRATHRDQMAVHLGYFDQKKSAVAACAADLRANAKAAEDKANERP